MRRHWTIAVVALLMPLWASSNANAHQLYDEEILLPARIELGRLVDLAATAMDFDIQYDPGSLNTEATFRVAEPQPASEVWSITRELLAMHGYTVIRTPETTLMRIVKAADAKRLARIDTTEVDPVVGFGSVVMELTRATPQEVAAALTPLLTPQVGSAAALGTAPLILIADLRPRLRELTSLAQRMDAEIAITHERISLKHVSAQRMAALVAQVTAKQELVAGSSLPGELLSGADGTGLLLIAPTEVISEWRVLIDTLDVAEPVVQRTYMPLGYDTAAVGQLLEATTTGIRSSMEIAVDDLTGTLVITAAPSQHDAIASTLERLAEARRESPVVMRSFRIRNRPVADLAGVLDGAIAGGALEATVAASLHSDEPAEDAATASVDDGAPSVVLTIDEPMNTIVAVGPAPLLAQLEQLVTSLDRRQAQVEIQVLLVSMNEGDSFDFGVELERLELHGGTAIKLASLFGLSTAAATDSIGRTVGDGAGFTGVVLDPGEFSVVVRAIETLNDGRAVRRPKLLVNNNQTASFDSVVQQPFISTNASDTVATTGFGGFEDAGTQITVTPSIAHGEHLILEYALGISAFVGESSSAESPPPRQQTQLQSVATVPDGHTIVVGGFEETTLGEAISQIPWIGHVPLIGELFKNRSESASRSRFYAFITATVDRDHRLTALRHATARDLESASVRDPAGWPVIKPQVIR